MNHTFVTECLLGQSRKTDILKNFPVLNFVCPRRLLRKKCVFDIAKTFFFFLLVLFCEIIELEKLQTKSDVEYKK